MQLGFGMSNSSLTSCSRLLKPQPSVGGEHEEKGDSLLRNDLRVTLKACTYLDFGGIFQVFMPLVFSVSWIFFILLNLFKMD